MREKKNLSQGEAPLPPLMLSPDNVATTGLKHQTLEFHEHKHPDFPLKGNLRWIEQSRIWVLWAADLRIKRSRERIWVTLLYLILCLRWGYLRKSPLEASLVAQSVRRLPAMQEIQVLSWVRKIPWRRKWQPISVVLPGKFRGQRSLVEYSPWGHKSLIRLRN